MRRPTDSTKPLLSKPISVVLWAVVITLFGVLAIGSLFMQKQLRKDTDLRGQASVQSGSVTITSPTTSLKLGTESQIQLLINTQQAQVSAIQLAFSINTIEEMKQFDFSFTNAIANSKLKVAHWNRWANNNGYDYVFMIEPAVAGDPFTTNGATQPLLNLSFVPTVANNYYLTFDQAKTVVVQYQSADQDILSPVANLTLAVNTDGCAYTYGAWSSCQNGKQIRTYTATPATCPAPAASQLEQNCLPQCSYVYSDWSACANGWQTRTVATTPTNCTWYQADTIQELSKACESTTYNPDFSMYTYEACWYTQTAGNSTYVIWNKNRYPNVTAIDVSIFSDFHDFAHKDVTGATSTLGDQHLVTDSTNFRTFTDGKNSLFAFYPEVYYYFRLWNGQHSSVIRFFVPKCAGVGGVSYKQCNETCTSNAECSPNLTCSNNQCRRAGNTDSTSCVLPPDNGLNRSCNEYCADSRECAAGLTCYYNRCRNPKNQTETSCKSPTAKKVVYIADGQPNYDGGKGGAGFDDTVIEAQCNETCASNRDCAIGLRCYENHCRLPANLASVICSATELGSSPTPTNDTVSTSSTGTTSADTSTDSGKNNDTKTTKTTTGENGKPTWIATILPKLPYVLGGLLLVIIALLFLPMLFADKNRSTVATPYQRTGVSDLEQQRIDQLRQSIQSQQTPKTESQNSMVERLKQRGVQPPGI